MRVPTARHILLALALFAAPVGLSAQVVSNHQGTPGGVSGGGNNGSGVSGNGGNPGGVKGNGGFSGAPSPTPTPSASPTPINAFAQAVASDSPYGFWHNNTTSGTEPDFGSGNNPLTYHGTGTRGGTGLTNDTGSGSYSPGGNTSNYLEAAAVLTGWPTSSTTTFTWGVRAKPNSTDCNGTAGPLANVLNTWGPTGTSTFSLDIVSDTTSCHLRATSDNGSNTAASANGSLASGSTYLLYLTYDKAVGMTVFICQITCTSSGTNSATYMNAWSAQSGPVMIGQFASRSVLNNPGAAGSFSGSIGDVMIFKTVLSTTRMSAHLAAASIATPTPAPTPTPTASPTPVPAGTLPPEGYYTSCEIDSALDDGSGIVGPSHEGQCELDDTAMVADGFSVEINYLGALAHKDSASDSIAAWLTFDSHLGMSQFFNVKNATLDTDPLTGTALAGGNLATDCGATNNQQIMACVEAIQESIPVDPTTHTNGFGGWYIYDEPGCSNQTIGYCQGSQAGKNYANIPKIATYLASISTKPIIGIQTPSGLPVCGSWTCSGAQTQIDNLYSCNGQPPCTTGNYPWLVSSVTPNVGYDYYPFGLAGLAAADAGHVDDLIQSTISRNYALEKVDFTGQAFSWFQEGNPGCTSITVCPYPTTAQMQSLRDNALYRANQNHNPIQHVFWYYWPDVICRGTAENYSGCNATTNRGLVKAAAFAAFPATPPP